MKHWILSLFLFFFLVEVFSLLPHHSKPAPEASKVPKVPFVSGLINVHTQFSDGYGTIPELALKAKKNGHSFVIFSDLASTEGRRLGLEKSYEGLDAFVEIESKTPSGNLLTFFSHTQLANKPPKELARIAYQHFLGEPSVPELFVSISHPSHIKKPWTQLERFPDGLEIFNWDALLWRKLQSNPIDFMGLSLMYPLNPFMASLRALNPYPKDIGMWDNMNTLGYRHFGILSSQFEQVVHLPLVQASWPTHEEIFGLGSNIVFLKSPPESDFQLRKKQIYRSIREARLAIAFQAIHPFDGNDFQIICSSGESFRSGDFIPEKLTDCKGLVSVPEDLPYSSKVVVYKDGDALRELVIRNAQATFDLTGRGQYRVEILVRPHSMFWILLRKWIPYVIYNPIFYRND